MNLYVQTIEGEAPARIDHTLWQLWTNCKTLAETASMAVHKHIRDRGGVLPTETVFVLRVLVATAEDMRANRGKPKTAICTVYNVRTN